MQQLDKVAKKFTFGNVTKEFFQPEPWAEFAQPARALGGIRPACLSLGRNLPSLPEPWAEFAQPARALG